jgi:hypothetical protein
MDATGVLARAHIEEPMQSILNVPLPPPVTRPLILSLQSLDSHFLHPPIRSYLAGGNPPRKGLPCQISEMPDCSF